MCMRAGVLLSFLFSKAMYTCADKTAPGWGKTGGEDKRKHRTMNPTKGQGS